MRLNLQRGLLLALTLPFLTACAGTKGRLKVGVTPEGEVVEAEGMVPYIDSDVPGTKSGGLAAAQRSAVEKVVGVYLAAETRVSKAITIDQKILANTSGYIKKYEILNEGREASFWKTKIRALVSFERVGQDLRALGLLDSKTIGNPRVIVLLDESIGGEPSDTSHAADGLTSSLVDRGYTVMDRAALAGIAMQDTLNAVEKGDAKAVKDLGSKVGAEVVVIGQGEATEMDPDPRLGGFVSYRAKAAGKAIRAGSGQILASISRQASGMDVNKAMAAAKALESAAKLLGEDLAVNIADVLKSRSEIVVRASQIKDMDQLRALQDALRSIQHVDALYLRSYANGEAEISLSAGTLQGTELGAKLSSLNKPPLQVKSMTASEVVVDLVQ